MMQDTNCRKILVIDDDITSLDIVSCLFERKGYEVERCADGYTAIESVRDMDPDLLIVDLMMPGINGVQTVEKIRNDLGIKTTPIIAFTAVDDPEVHEQAISAGCNEVLTKPCPSEKLVRAITRYLVD
jgi:CheY-like chemotaxis protein